MPQELHVLRCFACGTFQVHIVKKVLKWTCKMCQKKQSLLQEFARGSGRECRQLVQRLNEQRLELESFPAAAPFSRTYDLPVERVTADSKWNKYLDEKGESSEEELEAGIENTGPVKKQKKCGSRTVASRRSPKTDETDSNFPRQCKDLYEPMVRLEETGEPSKWARYIDSVERDETFEEQDQDIDKILEF